MLFQCPCLLRSMLHLMLFKLTHIHCINRSQQQKYKTKNLPRLVWFVPSTHIFSINNFTFFFLFFILAFRTTTAMPITSLIPSCPAGWLHCLNTAICIKTQWLCDGVPNCPGRWDEQPQNCPSMFRLYFWPLVKGAMSQRGIEWSLRAFANTAVFFASTNTDKS